MRIKRDFARGFSKRFGAAHFHNMRHGRMLTAVIVNKLDRRHAAIHKLRHFLIIRMALLGNKSLHIRIGCQRRAGRIHIHALTIGCAIKDITTTAEIHLRLALGHIKAICAFFQLTPIRHVGIKTMFRQIFRCHAEGHGLHLNGALATCKSFTRNRINFFDLLIGH